MLDFEERGIAFITFAAFIAVGTLVIAATFAYDIKYALGLDAPKLVLKQAGGLYAAFNGTTIETIEGMRQEYPSWFFDGSAAVRGGEYTIYQLDNNSEADGVGGLYVGVSDPNVNDSTWSGILP